MDTAATMSKVSTTTDEMEGPVVHSSPILVTGAGGWIASHVVYQLLDKGYNVRGTVRDIEGKKYEFLRKFHPRAEKNLELVEADLLKEEGWDAAMKNVQYVLHTASPFTLSVKNEEDLIKPAVQGTEAVFKAAFAHAGVVKRIVHTSSVVAVVYGHPTSRYAQCPTTVGVRKYRSMNSLFSGKGSGPEKLFDETEWSVKENIHGYEKSKTLAELKAWELVKEHNDKQTEESKKVELTVINPTFVFGPILAPSHAQSESSTHIMRIMNHTYPFVPEMESEHVDVRDVAAAHIRAMEYSSDKVAGKRFLLADKGGRLTFQQQSQILSDAFASSGFKIALKIAPNFLFSVGKWFLSDAKAAADKLGLPVGVSTKNAEEFLEFDNWMPIKESFTGHVVTLMKFKVIDRRQYPQVDVDSYKAYPNMCEWFDSSSYGSKPSTQEIGASPRGKETAELANSDVQDKEAEISVAAKVTDTGLAGVAETTTVSAGTKGEEMISTAETTTTAGDAETKNEAEIGEKESEPAKQGEQVTLTTVTI